MLDQLFRREVIEAKSSEWLGTIRLATPLSHRFLTLFALALCVAFVTFLILGHYTRRERTSGTLIPIAGLIEVTAATTGVVTRTFVEQGAIVRTGDPLVALSSERVSLALGETGAALSEQLRLQRARIDADIADLGKLQQDQMSGITTRAAMLRAQLSELDAQLAILRRQVVSTGEMLEKIKPLVVKGYISELQVKQEESAELDAEVQVKALTRQRLDTEQQISAQQNQLKQLPLTTDSQRHELERKRADVDQSLAQNEVQRASVLRAPQDAVVSSMLAKSGQTAVAGQVLLALVPRDSPLEAQLLVPSRAIGFVIPGNEVVLRYQAYPYQKFGLHFGRVKNISNSAMTPLQVSNLVGLQTQEAMYRVDVELDKQSIDAYGRQVILKPGMALDADILLDRRRLIEWVFEPLYGMGRQVEGTHG